MAAFGVIVWQQPSMKAGKFQQQVLAYVLAMILKTIFRNA